MQAEAIPVGALTHLNRAFIQFDGTYKLIDTGGGLVACVSKLKLRYPGLQPPDHTRPRRAKLCPSTYKIDSMDHLCRRR